MILAVPLALIQLFIITYIALQEYKRRSVSVFLWGMLLLLFGSMHCVTVIGNDPEYPLWVYNAASIFVIAFCFFYILTRGVTLIKNKKVITFTPWYEIVTQDISKTQKRFICITFIILIICVINKVYMLAQFAGGILNSSWSTGREMNQNLDYFNSGQIFTCLYYYSSSSILLFIYWGKKKLAFISGCLVLFMVIISRNRIEVLPLLVSIIAYEIYKGGNLTLKKGIFLCSVGCFSVVLIYALQIFRYYGAISIFITDFKFTDFNEHIFNNMFEGKGDIGLREVFYYFIYHDNKFENFGEGHTYLRMLMVLLPTEWSGGIKPPDFAISMGSAMKTGIEGFSTHPTLFGDCFANFGYLGVLMGIVWAWFVKIIDKIVNRKDVNLKISLIVLYANAFIIIGRGSVYNAFIWAFFGTILMGIIYKVIKV